MLSFLHGIINNLAGTIAAGGLVLVFCRGLGIFALHVCIACQYIFVGVLKKPANLHCMAYSFMKEKLPCLSQPVCFALRHSHMPQSCSVISVPSLFRHPFVFCEAKKWLKAWARHCGYIVRCPVIHLLVAMCTTFSAGKCNSVFLKRRKRSCRQAAFWHKCLILWFH